MTDQTESPQPHPLRDATVQAGPIDAVQFTAGGQVEPTITAGSAVTGAAATGLIRVARV